MIVKNKGVFFLADKFHFRFKEFIFKNLDKLSNMANNLFAKVIRYTNKVIKISIPSTLISILISLELPNLWQDSMESKQ